MRKKNLDKRLLEEVEDLFSIVPPKQLRLSIHEIFSNYLQTINNETDFEKFKILAEDFYFLNKFLEWVEEEKTKRISSQDLT
jgi:hypothetical protein